MKVPASILIGFFFVGLIILWEFSQSPSPTQVAIQKGKDLIQANINCMAHLANSNVSDDDLCVKVTGRAKLEYDTSRLRLTKPSVETEQIDQLVQLTSLQRMSMQMVNNNGTAAGIQQLGQ